MGRAAESVKNGGGGRLVRLVFIAWFLDMKQTTLEDRYFNFSPSISTWLIPFIRLWLPSLSLGFNLQGLGAEAAQPGENLPVLTQVAEVRKLTAESARRGYPVRLRGIVTYYDSLWHGVVVQDDTGGIFLESHNQEIPVENPASSGVPGLTNGCAVEVTGISDPGGFAPVVTQPQIRILGTGTLPQPKPVTFERMALGLDDCLWVETTGVVHTVHDAAEGSLFAREHLLLTAATFGGKFKVWIPNWRSPTVPKHLIDSRVSLRGVCGVSSNNRGQYQGVDMMVPELSQIRVLDPAPPNPFDAPACPINRLLRFSTNVIPEHRVKVSGIVTHHRPGKEMYLKDDLLGLHVLPLQTNRAMPGDRVEVVGFVGFDLAGPLLDGAHFRIVGSTTPPRPIRLEAGALLDGLFADELVQVEGRLQSIGQQGEGDVLVLESGNIVINAEIEFEPGKMVYPKEGCQLQLTGINVVNLDPLYKWPQRFRLLVRDPDDIKVLNYPSWWTPQRLAQALGSVCVITLAFCGWLMVLAKKNSALHLAETALQKANNELEQRVGERTAALTQANDALREQIEARSRAEEKLRQTQKLEAVGQLAAGVAHDFNNIFSAMLLNLGMMRTDSRFGPETQAMLGDIQSQVRRASSLTRQLLMYGQRQIIRRQAVDTNEVIGQVIQVLPRLLSDQIVVQPKLQPDLPPAEADPSLLEQGLMNLVLNARDAMPQGGTLSLASEHIVISEDAPNLNPESRPGHYVCITIADTGKGMDKATLKRVFEPFFTTKDVGQGTGMGLASVYGIIKQHHGWIEVESTLNQGSTFRLYLPLV
jgi:signal transduction histidine kinase